MLIMVITFLIVACNSTSPNSNSGNTTTQEDSNKDFGLSEFEKQLEEYEDSKRVIWQKPEMIISLIKDLEYKTVADIGAGSGYFAFRLAGRAERVIALEIDEQLISFMDSVKHTQLTPNRVDRFETRLDHDLPNLKVAEVDVVLLTNTYIYIKDRISYFSNLLKSLKSKGQVIIVDWKPENLPVGPEIGVKMSTFEVTQELQQSGYKIVNVDETSLQYQYIIIAESKY